MKKALATLCLVGSVITLSACDTTSMGFVDTQPPYGLERTATGYGETATETVVATPTRVAPAEKVFQRAQVK